MDKSLQNKRISTELLDFFRLPHPDVKMLCKDVYRLIYLDSNVNHRPRTLHGTRGTAVATVHLSSLEF